MKKLLLIITVLVIGFSFQLIAEDVADQCTSGNCIDGLGTMIYSDGSKYIGEFKESKFNGKGTYTDANGNKYICEFKDDKCNGQGTYIDVDGSKYVGGIEGYQLSGQGTMIFANKDKYVGGWSNDLMHGDGTLVKADGKVIKGTWDEGYNIDAEQYEWDKLNKKSISKHIDFIKEVHDDDLKLNAQNSLNELLELKLKKYFDSRYNPYSKYKELTIKSEDGTELGQLIDIVRIPLLAVNPNSGEKQVSIGLRENDKYKNGFDLVLNVNGKDVVLTFKPYKDWLVVMSLESDGEVNPQSWTYAVSMLIESMKGYPNIEFIDVELLEEL